jgi:hypothetical protein
MYFSVLLVFTLLNNFRQLFLVIRVPKNSNFGQNSNFSEKSEKFTENQKHKYEPSV